jgi:hypothetical protein
MLRQSLQLTVCLLGVNLLLACSSHSPDASSDTPDASAAPPATEARKPTVFDDQLKALDKAKAVEESMQKAKAERDKQMDEQSGG